MKDPYAIAVLGYISMMNTNFPSALQQLARAAHMLPNEPVLLLCLSVSQLQRATQRRTTNRNKDIITALGFMDEYSRLKQSLNSIQEDSAWIKQECAYNLGRFFHHLGVTHLAIQQYEKAIKLGEDIPEDKKQFNLTKEAAHNLIAIYRTNGSFQLARYLTIQHLSI